MGASERTVYVNGDFCLESEAKISVFDRGVLFADAIYEVCAVLDGKLLDTEAHFARMRRSLGEIKVELPTTDDELLNMMRELVKRNQIQEGLVYMQISRGVADRDFVLPAGIAPTVFAFTQDRPFVNVPSAENGIRVITVPDLRWARRDIKTVALLGPSLAKQRAIEAGVDDAWLVDDAGMVNEGTSNNAYIVTKGGELRTAPTTNSKILAGCTRISVLRLAIAKMGLEVKEMPFSVEEAYDAVEAFSTSAGTLVTGVIELDGRELSGGKPGPVSRELREIYLQEARATAV